MALLTPINPSFCLEQICESNYQKLLKLIPDLTRFNDGAIGYSPRNTPLHVAVIDRTAYTLTIELSHCFSQPQQALIVPAVRIRVYLDAKLAEVLSDHARAGVARVFKDARLSRDIMTYKWRLNYFLQKWLDHCLKKSYQFNASASSAERQN